jgi:Rrf2 family protein
MQITARTDYAIRAVCELAAAPERAWSNADLAHAQQLPAKFLESILRDLAKAGLVISQRGAHGGYRLARPAEDITLAEVMRAIDGPLAAVRGGAPEEAAYAGPASALTQVWVAVRAAVRDVLETTTVADLITGELPANVTELIADQEAWHRR